MAPIRGAQTPASSAWMPTILGFTNGLCDFDQPLGWRNTIVWSTPSLASHDVLTRTALASWTLSGNVTLDSGQPYSVLTGNVDNSYTGEQFDRADYLPGAPLHQGGRLNYDAFQLNAPGTPGNTPRNGFRSLADDEVDAALMKNFRLRERLGLMFRFEVFNIINHPNYYDPINAYNAATPQNFDTYQYANNPRQFQGALRLSF